MSKGWASAGLTVRSNLSPERGAKPVTSFVKNLSALSDWYSVYTSAIAFTVSAPHIVGACAPPGVGAVLPTGWGVCSPQGGGLCSLQGGGCAPSVVGAVLPAGWRGVCSLTGGGCAPSGVGAVLPAGWGGVLPDGRGLCSQWGGDCAPRRVGGVLPDGWGLCSPWCWGAYTPPQGFPGGDPPAVPGSSVGSSGLERCHWGQPGAGPWGSPCLETPHGSVLGEGPRAELVAGFPVGWGGSLAGHLPAPRLSLPHPQVYMNAVWHGWAIPMFLFLAILRLSLNYLIAR